MVVSKASEAAEAAGCLSGAGEPLAAQVRDWEIAHGAALAAGPAPDDPVARFTHAQLHIVAQRRAADLFDAVRRAREALPIL